MTSSVRGASRVDILLVLEGTFPYVRGGVSSWVYQLIREFSEYQFGVIFLGSAEEDYRGQFYELPENVTYYAEYFLYAGEDSKIRHGNGSRLKNYEAVKSAHDEIKSLLGEKSFPLDINRYKDNFGISKEDFFHGRESWDYLVKNYSEIPEKPAFVDYFWTIRGMHAPLWILQDALKRAPRPKIIHCPSTGYAGYLASLISNSTEKPLIISEHGIYTKERRIDLMLARWLNDNQIFLKKGHHINYLRQLWVHFFEFVGKLSYQQARHITNLFAGAMEQQIADGADPKKLLTIPNGVRVESFVSSRYTYPEKENVVALIGRVVPIKDIKTFIRAAKILTAWEECPEFWIVGPTEEDEEYYKECLLLVRHLGLEKRVRFTGYQPVETVLSQAKLTVLSSISEGLPLSVLESFAAGVPVVATDVGACRELLYGHKGGDMNAAAAGKIVSIADPEALAGGIRDVVSDPKTWEKFSMNAIERVEKNYREKTMVDHYRRLYEDCLAN